MDKKTFQKTSEVDKYRWEQRNGNHWTRATQLRKWIGRDKGAMNEDELRKVLIFIYTEIHKDNYVVESLSGIR